MRIAPPLLQSMGWPIESLQMGFGAGFSGAFLTKTASELHATYLPRSFLQGAIALTGAKAKKPAPSARASLAARIAG